MSGSTKSSTYLPSPVKSVGSSRRRTAFPKIELDAAMRLTLRSGLALVNDNYYSSQVLRQGHVTYLGRGDRAFREVVATRRIAPYVSLPRNVWNMFPGSYRAFCSRRRDHAGALK